MLKILPWPRTRHTAGCTQVLLSPGACTSEVNQILKPTFFISFSKLLVVVLGPVSVELVSVEDTPSAFFARYGIRKIFSHTYGFRFDGKIDLMEPRLKKTPVKAKLCLLAQKWHE